MKMHRLLIPLTLVNLGLLLFQLTQLSPPVAAQSISSVLRGRALEIVDEQGRVRASVKVQPAGAMPTGEAYPETVILRLIDPDGRPSVKLAGSGQGSGLSLLGDSDPTYIVLNAQGTESSLKLMSGDGRQQLVKP
jgi:hypothetical protein